MAMSEREDLVTGVLGVWLLAGLFLDGWAHNTRPRLETFVTPWHAVFYSGFLAISAWVVWSVHRRRAPGQRWWHAVPPGYRAAVVGLAVFHISGAGDAAWHSAFGIERNEAALLSPTHLGLYVGAFLTVSAPLRSRWADGRSRGASWAALLSLALTADLTAFILQNFSPVREDIISKAAGRYIAFTHLQPLADRSVEHVEASFILTTVFLFGPLLIAMRRWDLRPSAVALLIGTQCVLMQGLRGFDDPGLALLGVTGGVAVAGVTRWLRPSRRDVARVRAWSALAPVTFWAWFIGGIALHDRGLGFKAEIWGGTLVWTALTGVALTVLLYGQAVPAAVDASPGGRRSGRGRWALLEDGDTDQPVAHVVADLACLGLAGGPRREQRALAGGHDAPHAPPVG